MTAGPDGVKYVLKRWFSERECSLRDRKEILFCTRQIAALHRGLQEIPWQEEWSLGSTVVPALSEEMARHSREMKRVRDSSGENAGKQNLNYVSCRALTSIMVRRWRQKKGWSRWIRIRRKTGSFVSRGFRPASYSAGKPGSCVH